MDAGDTDSNFKHAVFPQPGRNPNTQKDDKQRTLWECDERGELAGQRTYVWFWDISTHTLPPLAPCGIVWLILTDRSLCPMKAVR